MSEKNPFYGATFAERKAIREAVEPVEAKQVNADDPDLDVEDKAVKKAATKRTPKKKA